MNSSSIKRGICAWLACCALIVSGLGCGGSDPLSTLAKANERNIQRLSNLYLSFHSLNDWRGPNDEEEFKAFLREMRPERLRRIGIEPAEVDQIFINERDGEPFKVRYGVPGSMMGSSDPVIFEATGVNGKRMVGFLNMVQREVDNTEYERLWSGDYTKEDLSPDGDTRRP